MTADGENIKLHFSDLRYYDGKIKQYINNKIQDPSVTSNKIDKVTNATDGNFASLDSNGNIKDSGHKHEDYLTSIPVASTEAIGGIKIDGSTITVDENGVAKANSQIIQTNTMPTAAAKYNQKIVQYIGATDVNYTRGYFYQCVQSVSDENDVSYAWARINVQPVVGDMPVASTSEIGGVKVDGTTITINNNGVISSQSGTTVQVNVMPEALNELEGKIYQYIGMTTALYTNGYFYKCVESNGSYLWVQIDTQPSGSFTLSDLSDVNISNPSGGQGLVYDATNEEWVNGEGGGGSSTLSGLSDVNVTNPTEGQCLVYDATNDEWVNANVSGGNNISVNGETLVISHPSGGGGTGGGGINYSTTEQDTGLLWVNGKHIYQKTVVAEVESGTVHNSAFVIPLLTGDDEIETPVSFEGLIEYSIGGAWFPLSHYGLPEYSNEAPAYIRADLSQMVRVSINTQQITILFGKEFDYYEGSDAGIEHVWEGHHIIVTVRYTKVATTPSAPTIPDFSTATDAELTSVINGYYNGDYTLEDIQEVWSVGDTREISLGAIAASGGSGIDAWEVDETHSAQTITLQIIDFDHDTLTTPVNGKTKALITVDLKEILHDVNTADDDQANDPECGYMNSNIDTGTGWQFSNRRRWCNDGFFNALPSYIKALNKSVDKLTARGNGISTIVTTSDKVFLKSEIETTGYGPYYSYDGEGTQYQFYEAGYGVHSWDKDPKWDNSAETGMYYFRSPANSYNDTFVGVASTGLLTYISQALPYGFEPAFCM